MYETNREIKSFRLFVYLFRFWKFGLYVFFNYRIFKLFVTCVGKRPFEVYNCWFMNTQEKAHLLYLGYYVHQYVCKYYAFVIENCFIYAGIDSTNLWILYTNKINYTAHKHTIMKSFFFLIYQNNYCFNTPSMFTINKSYYSRSFVTSWMSEHGSACFVHKILCQLRKAVKKVLNNLPPKVLSIYVYIIL